MTAVAQPADPRILVAGVGNIFLRDDGFGPEVVRRLAADRRDGPSADRVRVVDYGIRGMHLAYDLLDGVDALVLVDAVPAEGSDPGSIRVLQVRPEDLGGGPPASGLMAADPHGMDPVAVLGRLRLLGGEFPLTYVVGCVPADTTEGMGLTPAVAAAVPDAIAAVRALLTHPPIHA